MPKPSHIATIEVKVGKTTKERNTIHRTVLSPSRDKRQREFRENIGQKRNFPKTAAALAVTKLWKQVVEKLDNTYTNTHTQFQSKNSHNTHKNWLSNKWLNEVANEGNKREATQQPTKKGYCPFLWECEHE